MTENLAYEELEQKIGELEKDAQERLEFIKLLTDLSRIFVKIKAEDIDRKVEEVLQRIGEILGVDRTDFIQNNEESGCMEITHSWTVSGIESYSRILTDEHYPWLTENIKSLGKHVFFPTIDSLPKQALTDKKSFKKMGIKSGLIIPYSEKGNFMGAIAFGTHNHKIAWNDMQIQRLKLLGEIIFNALRRKQTDFELMKRQESRLRFEHLLTKLSSDFINISADNVDENVKTIMRHISEILGIDRATFWQLSSKDGEYEITHSWTARGVEPLPRIIAKNMYPWMLKKLYEAKKYFVFRIDKLPKEAAKDKKSFQKSRVKSGLLIPYFIEGVLTHIIAFGITKYYRAVWPEEYIQRLRLLGEIIYNALRRKQADLDLEKAFLEIKKLKDQLQKENVSLREEIKVIRKHEEIVGESDVMLGVLQNIEEVAETDASVLILGETGTGKELIARAIHNLSRRKKRSMIIVNCAALPATLMESELFGREKGAYTGAMTKQAGRFEKADGTTLFLDEIGELPMDLQAKLLRVLQEGQFERLGSSKTISVNIRLITATNRNLEKAVREGKFREDLYYRLNVFPVKVPPLRERPDDILPLIWHFVKEFSETMGKRIEVISRKNLEAVKRYSWPGNVRELRNVVERSMILSKGKNLLVNVPGTPDSSPHRDLSLEEYNRNYILEILKKTGWRIRGEKGAAEILDIKPTTLYSRMKKLGIKRDDSRSGNSTSGLNINT